MISMADIRRALVGRSPRLLPLATRTHAAVALILRETSTGPAMLFIQRARHEGDPWSGDLGFPGGKLEADDSEPRAAAERETREEIGLDLDSAEHLGRLDDILGAYLPVLISCFVYVVRHPERLTLSEEVTDAFWFPVQGLLDPKRRVEVPVRFQGQTLRRPATRLLGLDRPVLWGITYRLVDQFLGIVCER